MESLLIQNGRVIDPANGIDAHQSLLILNGKIAALGAEADAKAGDEIKVIDARGKVVCPGLVDIHVHMDIHKARADNFPSGVNDLDFITSLCIGLGTQGSYLSVQDQQGLMGINTIGGIDNTTVLNQ